MCIALGRLMVELMKVSSPDVRKAVAAIFSDCVTPLLFPAQAVQQHGAGQPVRIPADAIPRELPDSLAPPPPPPPMDT